MNPAASHPNAPVLTRTFTSDSTPRGAGDMDIEVQDWMQERSRLILDVQTISTEYRIIRTVTYLEGAPAPDATQKQGPDPSLN